MAAAQRKAVARRKKRPAAAGGGRRGTKRTRDQGGTAALVIALVLVALWLSEPEWDGYDPSDSGQDGGVTSEVWPSDADDAIIDGDGRTEVESGEWSEADDDEEREAEGALFAAINRVRSTEGLPALRASTPLARAAQAHSADLRATSRCSHDGSDGSSLEDRLAIAAADVRWYGEIIACGSVSAEAAVEQWLDSDAHQDILLGRDYESVGVGVALGANGAADARWTAVLGTP